jgi:hypothetical protein
MGKVFPGRDTDIRSRYSAAVAHALRRAVGDSHQAIKTVMRWTGANERTVKNWFSGANGPSGAHLIVLAGNSGEVLEAFLTLAGHDGVLAAKKLIDARDKIAKMLELINSLTGEAADRATPGK